MRDKTYMAGQTTRNWGTSSAELVWRRFTRSPLNIACLGVLACMLIVAIVAPFIANDKPLVIRINERVRWPLFRSLGWVDCAAILAAVVGLIQVILARRNVRRYAPSVRGDVLCRQLGITCASVLAGGIVLYALIPRRLDGVDYRALIASGRATHAVFAPVPFGCERTDLAIRGQPPGAVHRLGTDDVGADVLARLIHASRISLSVGVVAVGISTAIGVAAGAVLGYSGGRIDLVGMRLIEIVMAVPALLLVITVFAFFPRSVLNIMLIIGLTSWTGTARLVRAEFLKLRRQDFVPAALSLGIPRRSIMFRHILPNAVAPALVNAAFGMSAAIFTESALSFLGFGIAPPTPSWGQMLSLGVAGSGRFVWWLALFPGLAIFIVVIVCNLTAEGLRDAIDPRLGRAI